MVIGPAQQQGLISCNRRPKTDSRLRPKHRNGQTRCTQAIGEMAAGILRNRMSD